MIIDTMATDKQQANKRSFEGTVVSIGMQHTVMVKVDRVRIHPTYEKRYTVSKRYACDYRAGDLVIGDRVRFEECRPLSKTKRWRIIKKI